MEHYNRRGARAVLLWALAVLLLAGGTALADEPTLGVHADGSLNSYPISTVERIEFANDTLVVVTIGTTDTYPLDTVDKIDFSSISTSVAGPELAASLPKILSLFPNQPNPLSSETKIAFRLPEPGHVDLKVFSVNGRLVRTLASGDHTSGLHSVVWDGRDDEGREVSAGVYLYLLAGPGIEESRRMVLLR